MTNSNVERKFRMVDINLLTSGLTYQRSIDEDFVKEKVKSFDKNEVEPVCVSFRDGRYNVVDGQHTIAILKNVGWNKVYCEVRTGMTEANENAWFVSKETKHRKQTKNRILNGRYFGGEDEVINDLVAYLSTVGYKLNTSDVKCGEGIINASGAIEKIFLNLGKANFLKYISLHQAAWNGNKKSLQAPFLKGLEKFYNTYGSDIEEKRFIHVFNTTVNKKGKCPEDIIIEANRDVDTKDSATRYAKVLVRNYNSGLAGNKKIKMSKLED